MDISEKIIQQAHCCSCGQSLQSSEHVNMVQTSYAAPEGWSVSGNILLHTTGQAMAIFCDTCVEGEEIGEVKEIINTNTEVFQYLLVEKLEKLPILVFYQDSPSAGHPKCRCSACQEKIPKTHIPVRIAYPPSPSWEHGLKLRFHKICWMVWKSQHIQYNTEGHATFRAIPKIQKINQV